MMVDDFYKRARYVLVAATLLILGCLALWFARVILLLFFAAILLSVLLCTIVNWVVKHTKLPRVWALVSVLLSLSALATVALIARGPAIVEQFGELGSRLPSASMQVWNELSGQSWAQWLTSRAGTSGQIANSIGFMLDKMGNALNGTLSFVLGLLIILFATLYLSSEPDAYLTILFRLIPVQHHERTKAVLLAITLTLRSWLVAKLISMAAIGVIVSLGLWALSIPLAGTLGILAGLMTFIPNVGALASVLPAGLLAFAISPQKGLLTIGLFALAHFLEGNIITPMAEREFAKMPPALTLAVQLVLGLLTGGIGIALAAPITAAALTLLRMPRYSQEPVPMSLEDRLSESEA